MWRSDPTLAGPMVASVEDIDALNRIFSEAFTDRYRRDGLAGVRVPFLNPLVWRYAIADAGDGAMVWRDGRGDLVAFNMVHRSGSEGWMGPLAVRVDRQGRGHGQRIVGDGVTWLQAQGARTIGLETMPRTIENIGFYSQLGFIPDRLTVTLQRAQPRASAAAELRLSLADTAARVKLMGECLALSNAIRPGLDFTREIELSLALQLGDVTMIRGGGEQVTGFALWHTAPLAQGRGPEDVRILKLVAADTADAMQLIAGVERAAHDLGLQRVAVRCQTREAALYTALVADGFRVQWTDLRMTLAHHAEPAPRGVLLSNWEI